MSEYKNSRGQHVPYLATENDTCGAEFSQVARGKYNIFFGVVPPRKPFCNIAFDYVMTVTNERDARRICRGLVKLWGETPRLWCTSQMAIFDLFDYEHDYRVKPNYRKFAKAK